MALENFSTGSSKNNPDLLGETFGEVVGRVMDESG
jgi:hypothetical protein